MESIDRSNKQSFLRNIANPTFVSLVFLGFASGLPLSLTTTTIQAWLTSSHVNIKTIGLFSLVGLPYLWKFIWAPLLDRFVPPFLDRRRSWIVIAQCGIILGLLIFSVSQLKSQIITIAIVALSIAFLSASQDIGVDAYRTDILKPNERAFGSAIFNFGYRMAMLVSGGVALIIADKWGWSVSFLFLAMLMLVMMLATIFSRPVPRVEPPDSIAKAIVLPLLNLINRPGILIILIFIVFYKFGDAFALSLFTPFLIKGLGFSLTQIGYAYKTSSLLALIIGTFAGGLLMTRINLYKALLYFGIFQALTNLLFVWLALVGKNFPLMLVSVFIENLASGMATVAFLAFLMSLCDRRYSASQYALLTALSSIGRVLIGYFSGVIVTHYGWANFFICSCFVSLPGLFFLMLIRSKIILHSEQVKC